MRAAHPQIPWRLVIANCNWLIHGYLGIDSDALWSIIRSDVPACSLILWHLKPNLSDAEIAEFIRMGLTPRPILS